MTKIKQSELEYLANRFNISLEIIEKRILASLMIMASSSGNNNSVVSKHLTKKAKDVILQADELEFIMNNMDLESNG